MKIKQKFYWFDIIKISIVLFLGVLCILYYDSLNRETITLFLQENKKTAPLIFIIICALKPVLFFLPTMGLNIAAGILFGLFWGTIYVVVGGLLSTIIGFYFARWFGYKIVRWVTPLEKTIELLDEFIVKYKRFAIFFMRLCNIPWDLVSYGAGISNIKFKDFYVPSVIIIVPISFLYTYFGTKILTPKSWGFIIAFIIIISLGTIPIIKMKIKMKKFLNVTFVFSMLFLSGCAGSSRYMKKTEKPTLFNQDKAIVYFMRPSALGYAINFQIWDGEKFIGLSQAKSYFVYECNPGEHTFLGIAENKVFIDAELEAGKIYYVLAQVKMGVWRARIGLIPVKKGSIYEEKVKVWENSLNYIEPIASEVQAWENAKKNDAKALIYKFKNSNIPNKMVLTKNDGI